jgi:hypothetical protein
MTEITQIKIVQINTLENIWIKLTGWLDDLKWVCCDNKSDKATVALTILGSTFGWVTVMYNLMSLSLPAALVARPDDEAEGGLVVVVVAVVDVVLVVVVIVVDAEYDVDEPSNCLAGKVGWRDEPAGDEWTEEADSAVYHWWSLVDNLDNGCISKTVGVVIAKANFCFVPLGRLYIVLDALFDGPRVVNEGKAIPGDTLCVLTGCGVRSQTVVDSVDDLGCIDGKKGSNHDVVVLDEGTGSIVLVPAFITTALIKINEMNSITPLL